MEKNNGINTNLLEFFSRYCKDNQFTLTGLGVIATVTALFLNLETEKYGETLTDIQVLLLIFLTLSCSYLAFNTIVWFRQTIDSWLGGTIGGLTLLLPYYVIRFIIDNFREELGNIMILASIGIFFSLSSLLQKQGVKIENFFKKYKTDSVLISPIIYFVTLYIYLFLSRIYLDFSNNETLEIASLFITTLKIPILYILPLAILVIENFVYHNKKEKFKNNLHKTVYLIIVLLIIVVGALTVLL